MSLSSALHHHTLHDHLQHPHTIVLPPGPLIHTPRYTRMKPETVPLTEEDPARFSDFRRYMADSTTEESLIESWKDLLKSLEEGVNEIKRYGPEIVPEIAFEDLQARNEKFRKWLPEAKKRGVVIIRNVVDQAAALEWKQQAQDYIATNPQVRGFPPDRKDLYEVYWSKPQIQARSHPNVLQTQRALLQLFHAPPTSLVSLNTPVAYVDRLGMRQPGKAEYVLGPHIDGNLGRLDDPIYRSWYKEIFQGRWKNHDPYDISGRLDSNRIGAGVGQCGVLRPWQGLLSLSHTGPNEGTLRTYPLLKESISYIHLRPLFEPKLDPTSPGYLKAENWSLNMGFTSIPGRPMAHRIELTAASHPHLQLNSGGLISVKALRPGDMLFWHHDSIHAGEVIHSGKGDASVFYIPSVPLTLRNTEYILAEREALSQGGMPPPDFTSKTGESDFTKRGTADDVKGEDGRKAMGLTKFTPWKGASEGELRLINGANQLLGF